MNIDQDKKNYHTNEAVINQALILDSNHRDVATYPLSNSFMIDLESTATKTTITTVNGVNVTNTFTGGIGGNKVAFRDVIAIKLIGFEIFGATSNFTAQSVYLQINDYSHALTGSESINNIFARFTLTQTGVTFSNTTSPDMTVDPYTYICNPVIGNLRRFTINLLNANGTPFNAKGATIIVSLSIYSKRNKFSRA
jgi:hypothetical protein